MKKQIILLTLILIFTSIVSAQETEVKPVKAEMPKAAKKIKLPTAKKLFEQHIKATGGKKAAEKIKNRQTTGTVEMPAMGLKGTFETLSKAPNKTLVTMNLSGFGEITEAFDGSEAWSKNPLQGLRVKTGKELEDVKESADFYYDLNLGKTYPKAAVIELKNIDGAEAYVVKADDDTTFYFDKQSGLMTRVDRVVTSPEGKINSVTKFEDFRVVDGVNQTFRVRQSALGAEFVFNVSEVKQNVEIADERFSKPK